MPVEAERLDDEGLELAGEEIGQEEGRDVVVPPGEGLVAGKEGITVRAGDAFDAELLADLVEKAAGAAIGIADEDA